MPLKKTFLLVSTILLLIFSAAPAFAAGDLTITVSPTIIELELNPGETIKRSINVSSSSRYDAVLSTSIKDFYYDENTQLQFMTPEELEDPEFQKFSLQSWVNIKKVVPLKANQVKKVQFTITAPEDASPGGHYGMILFGQSAGSGTAQSAVSLGGRVGVMVLTTIPGEYSTEGGVIKPLMVGKVSQDKKSFTPQRIFPAGSEPIDFAFEFENNSGTHVMPKGHIIVQNIFGKIVGLLPIEGKRIFPGTSRSLYAHFNKDFLLGWYSAALTVTDSEGNQYYSKVSFSALPLKQILLSLLIVVLFLIFFGLYKKRLARQILKEHTWKEPQQKQ